MDYAPLLQNTRTSVPGPTARLLGLLLRECLLVASALFLLCPIAGIATIRYLIEKGISAMPIVPLLLYGVAALFMIKLLLKPVDKAVAIEAGKDESANLTLTGFCFTSMSLLVGFFKEELKKGNSGPQQIILFFGVALGSFIASNMALRFRTRQLSIFGAQAFTDNGLWCILLGLRAFLTSAAASSGLPKMFDLLLVLFCPFILWHLLLWRKYLKAIP